jgi:multidrug efflux pump subunit AcrA (membrane-fusion protein)
MKPPIIAALVIVALASASCSRKAPQAGPAAPEVLVTTVQPRDLERVATLDGFINANINAPSRLQSERG